MRALQSLDASATWRVLVRRCVLVYGAGTVGAGGTWPAVAQFSLLIMVKTSFKAKAQCAISISNCSRW